MLSKCHDLPNNDLCVFFYYYSNRLQNPWVNPFVYGFAFFISGHHHYFSFVLISFFLLSFSAHSPYLSLSLFLSLFLFLSPYFFFFLMLSFLISILENFQTLHMNWALPYKCVRIYTEAHAPKGFWFAKGSERNPFKEQ